MKKFVILIEDDHEIMANGIGNVADMQYLPSLALMKIANKYNAKITFMVDVAQKFALEANASHPELKIQSTLMDETIILMKEMGHDVQLHIHPQWLNSSYKNGHFYLTEKWNIGRYSQEEQRQLIEYGVNYLNSLLSQRFPNYKVCAFKPGSWGMQPCNTLFSELERAGINIVLGVREGLQSSNQGVNYSNLEEKYLPYYPDTKDIRKIAKDEKKLVVIPLQPYNPDLITFSKFLIYQAIGKLRTKNTYSCHEARNAPRKIMALNPVSDQKKFTLSPRPYHTHLKIGNHSFSYLKASFDNVIRNLDQYDIERIPIVIESHTKLYRRCYKDIEKFIAYLAENYESKIEFGDMTSFSKELITKTYLPKKNAN